MPGISGGRAGGSTAGEAREAANSGRRMQGGGGGRGRGSGVSRRAAPHPRQPQRMGAVAQPHALVAACSARYSRPATRSSDAGEQPNQWAWGCPLA